MMETQEFFETFDICSELMRLVIRRGTAVGTETGYGLDDRGDGVRGPMGSRIFTFPRRPDRLCISTNLP
jgi:hypothetical protein